MRMHKLDLTRPELLVLIMGKDPSELTMVDMKRVLHDTNALCYAVYTVLMEADIKKKDIIAAYNDSESVALTLKSKSLAKEIKEKCHKEIVRYGSRFYRVYLKTRDQHLIAEVEEIEIEPEEEQD